jgi:hypothetical protein
VDRCGGEASETEASGIGSAVEPELHDMVDDVWWKRDGREGVPFLTLSREERAGERFLDERRPTPPFFSGIKGLKYVARDPSELDESRDGVELDVLDGFVKLNE